MSLDKQIFLSNLWQTFWTAQLKNNTENVYFETRYVFVLIRVCYLVDKKIFKVRRIVLHKKHAIRRKQCRYINIHTCLKSEQHSSVSKPISCTVYVGVDLTV
jgi:hypothetical protein